MKDRDWLDQPPGDIAKSIIIEAAELLEHFQWSTFFSEQVELDPTAKAEIIEELADVFIYAIEMSIILNCSIEDIVRKKLAKAALKYPVTEVSGKLGSRKYREIKRNYRTRNA